MNDFNGLGMHMGNLSLLSAAKSRSISPENFTGAKSAGGLATEGASASDARELGKGWKVSPCVWIKPGEQFTLAEIEGPGAIQQIWMTPTSHWRHLILRFYWDGQEQPSVECPMGDFFASGWQEYAQVSSLAVCVNPRSGLNCYWEMPFRRHCRITVENIGLEDSRLFYQISYALTEVPDNAAYFHAQFRRSNPVPYGEVHTIVDGIAGQGHYVGTYLAWGSNARKFYEGEVKFYLDGDPREPDQGAPTICGTGTEDYFGGSYGFVTRDAETGAQYREFTTPYSGLPQVIRPDGTYRSQQRYGMYRWHITDPIRFETDLAVIIQVLGHRSAGLYAPLQDDVASVAYWYQTLPTAEFPALPDRDYLEII